MSRMVSVVIATRDRPDLLTQALASLARQTMKDFELIVADDGSEDADAVKDAAAAFGIRKLIRHDSPRGPGAARNAAIREAAGKYVAILDDDDIAREDRLEKQVAVLESRPDIGLTFSAVHWFRADGKPFAVFPGIVAAGQWQECPAWVFRLLYLESNKIPNTTVLARRELFESFQYPEWTRIGEDWFLFLQMAAKGVRMHAISECLVWIRRDSQVESLVQMMDEFWAAQERVLIEIRNWLTREGIREFDALHRRARANLLARRARRVSGWSGLGMAVAAVAQSPAAPDAWCAVRDIAARGIRKACRTVVRPVLGT